MEIFFFSPEHHLDAVHEAVLVLDGLPHALERVEHRLTLGGRGHTEERVCNQIKYGSHVTEKETSLKNEQTCIT